MHPSFGEEVAPMILDRHPPCFGEQSRERRTEQRRSIDEPIDDRPATATPPASTIDPLCSPRRSRDQDLLHIDTPPGQFVFDRCRSGPRWDEGHSNLAENRERAVVRFGIVLAFDPDREDGPPCPQGPPAPFPV